MFKLESSEAELQSTMAKLLLDKQVEVDPGVSKVEQALNLLKNAANAFDQAGLIKEADEITRVMNKLTWLIELE